MSNDSVSVAFQLIIEEIDGIISEINEQGAGFMRNSQYGNTELSIASGKKLADFRVKLEKLMGEWTSGLDETTRKQIIIQPEQVARTFAATERTRRTVLIVKFPDNSVIYEAKAAETFSKALKKIGLPQISNLGIRVNNHPLVSKTRSANYTQTEIDGHLIMTHSSTAAKRDILLEIANKLNISISVDVVPV